MTDVRSFLDSFGCAEMFPLDGTIHRFSRNGNNSGWFWGVEAFKLQSGEPYIIVVVGDWNGSERQEFKTNAVLDKQQRKDCNAKLKQLKEAELIKRKEIQREAADRAKQVFDTFAQTGSTDYLARKQITQLHGSRISGTDLIVPTRDGSGELTGFQRISADGRKLFCSGQRKLGCFHAIPTDLPFKDDGRIFVVEGFATGVSVYEATMSIVVVALDAGNLTPVATYVRKKYPDHEIIIAADNDQFTDKNAGIAAANGAAAAVNGRIIFPKFKDSSTKPTDWNDLHILEGISSVQEQLNEAKAPESKDVKDTEYTQYALFFDRHLSGSKKDLITKEFLRFDGHYWQSPLNNLDAIRSYASGLGLKSQSVQMHLDRYILEKPLELLLDIEPWDGIDRIKGLGLYLKFKDRDFSVFEDALKEWGANIFRRLHHQNMQNRCIILKGEQGLGKDRLLKTLLSGFEHYYQSFTSNRDERECWGQVTESLVLHIEEFDQTGSMPVAFLKDLITRNTVKYRSPYDRKALVKKCVGSFISSVNIDDILRDETGNRRFAVFELESIDWDYPKNFGPQIMAQFYALYQADFWAKDDTWNLISVSNEKFTQVDIVSELLDMWDSRIRELCAPARGTCAAGPGNGKARLTFNDVASCVTDLSRAFNLKTRKILGILKSNRRSDRDRVGHHYWSGPNNPLLGKSVTDRIDHAAEIGHH